MLAVAVMTALTVTMFPKKAVAANAVVEVLKVAAIFALVAIEIDEMNKCNDGLYQYCDYYDHNHCQYQTITRTDLVNTCTQYGKYGPYECVQSHGSSSYYIKSCSGFKNYYN